MTDRLRICDYNDHDDATLSLSIAAATGFDAELTQNMTRDDEWRSASLSSVTMSGLWNATRTVSHFSLHHHGLLGANVRFQLFSDAGLTTPASGFNDSGTIAAADFTDPAIVVSGFEDSRGNADPFAADASFFLWFDETAARGYKITFSGTPDDWAFYWVSRIFVGRYKQMTRTAKFGAAFPPRTLSRGNRTFGGSKRTYRGASYRSMEFDLDLLTDAQRDTWNDIYANVDISRDCVISIMPEAGTREERDTTYAGTFSNLGGIRRERGRATTRIVFEEN